MGVQLESLRRIYLEGAVVVEGCRLGTKDEMDECALSLRVSSSLSFIYTLGTLHASPSSQP